LRLIAALLAVDTSDAVVQRLTGVTVQRMVAKDADVRRLSLESFTPLAAAMSPAQYFVLFQSLKSELNEGYKIPLLYVALKIMIESAATQGAFDGFLGLLVETLLEDLFGPSAHIRTQLRNTVPEARTCVTFESFQRLAQGIEFAASARELIGKLTERFDRFSSPEQLRGAKLLISAVSAGFADNLTVNPRVLCEIDSELLRHALDLEGAQQPREAGPKVEYARKYHADILFDAVRRDTPVSDRGSPFLSSLFATKLLEAFFVRDLFDTADARQVALLQELFPKLWQFTQTTRDSETVIASATIIRHYLGLPGFPAYLPDVVNFLAETLARMSSAADAFGQAIFGLLGAILGSATPSALELPTKFTRTLVTFCNSQLDVYESCEAVFGVLNAVIARRRDIPEVYDLARTAFDLVVRAPSDAVRKRCASFCALFMNTYELAEAHFREHLQFVLANLPSPRGPARRALLSLLAKLFRQLAEQRLNEYAELVFLHFAARIANETEPAIAAKLHKAVVRLLVRVSHAKFHALWQLMVRWASAGGNQVRSGLLLLAVTVGACPDALANLVDALQQLVDAHIAQQNARVRIAALELHRAIATAYPADTKLIPIARIVEFVRERETCKIACELLLLYLTELPAFDARVDEWEEAADALAAVVVGWCGAVKEAADSLHRILVKLPVGVCTSFFGSHVREWAQMEAAEAVIAAMRVAVATVIERGSDEAELIRSVLWLIVRAQEGEDTRRAAEKAVEVVRNAIDPDAFTKEWTAILEEEEEKRKKEEAIREVEAEIDPEAFKKKVADERQKAKIEKRRKRYLTDTGERGTLHPFGEDGRVVERVPLAREFR
jgi:U3 small nucleolar RNA-associated protein 20